MVKYSISHFVWFSNNDSTLCRKPNIISLQIAIAADTSQQPLRARCWERLEFSTQWPLQRHSAHWAGRVTVGWHKAFCLLVAAFVRLLCTKGPKPESQNGCQGGLMPPIWEQGRAFWNCPKPRAPASTVPVQSG